MEESNAIIKVPLKHLIEWAHRLSNLRMVLDNVRNKVDGIIKQELRNDLKDVADCMSTVNVSIREDCIGILDQVIGVEIEKENE